ncbi:MAG: ATP-binding protein [Cytophagales bacterium]|nr:ATP-binding protein [Cytophagales bacterium]
MIDQGNEVSEFAEKFDLLDIFELLPDGVLLVDKFGKIRVDNSKVTEIFGYRKHELLDKDIESLIPEQFRLAHSKHRERYASNPERKMMNTRKVLIGRKKGGEDIEVEISLGPITIRNQKLTIAIIRDASARNHIEYLERINNELEQISYFIAHDLSEPLRTVDSFVHLINIELADQLNNHTTEYLSHISQACQRMSNIIQDLIKFATIDKQNEYKRINCFQILDDLKKDLKLKIQESGAQIEIGNLPYITADETGIRLLFQNLISNAIKFSKANESPQVAITATEEEAYWKFMVRDHGIGISPEQHYKIFQIFHRLHDKKQFQGTGIGLSHCKKIVEKHGGKIWVESALHQGSTFYFTIKKPSSQCTK